MALPIFSKAQNQVFSVVGQYISNDMAQALGEVLNRVHSDNEELAKMTITGKEDDEVPYIQIREVNFDDNGLKDTAFASILKALATQPSLKRISYVNNEIGSKSVEQIAQILNSKNGNELQDLRITRVKSTKHDLN